MTDVSDFGCFGSSSTSQPAFVRHLMLRDGWQILTRPIRPDDGMQICQLLENVSADNLRLRFFETIQGFSRLLRLESGQAAGLNCWTANIDPL